ncbi:unnamed protein product [Dicrocoelium dendriticum]|nr:unnamed protein product [Dicrocoelium dendriticum]
MGVSETMTAASFKFCLALLFVLSITGVTVVTGQRSGLLAKLFRQYMHHRRGGASSHHHNILPEATADLVAPLAAHVVK